MSTYLRGDGDPPTYLWRGRPPVNYFGWEGGQLHCIYLCIYRPTHLLIYLWKDGHLLTYVRRTCHQKKNLGGFYLPIYPSTYPLIVLMYLSSCLHTYLSTYLLEVEWIPIYRSTFLLDAYLHIYLSIGSWLILYLASGGWWMPIYLSAYLATHMSTYLPVYLSAYLR